MMNFDNDDENEFDIEFEEVEKVSREAVAARLRRLGGFSEKPSRIRLGKHERSILKHIDYALYRVRARHFRTPKHLATSFSTKGRKKKPERWALLLRDYAIEQGKITLEEWRASFRKRGRPRKGKPRGPYKKRESAS